MRKLKSVLLVDDDDTTNFLNRLFIKQVDGSLEVNAVGDGKEAIKFLESGLDEENTPCLLILDTNMPVMNGWEFLDTYQQRFDGDFKNRITIIMLVSLDIEAITSLANSNPNVAGTAEKPLSDLKFRGLINKYFS